MDKTCERCDGRLPLTMRAGARFCSGACRVAAHRERKRREAQPVPERMAGVDRWVRWRLMERNGKLTKAPIRLSGRLADVRDSAEWVSFEAVSASRVGDGMGIVLGDGLGCIDLDHCIVDGVVASWAQAFIDHYRGEAVMIERSFSGDGVHIFLEMPEGPGRRIRDGVQNVEIYSRGRYIAVTGDRI